MEEFEKANGSYDTPLYVLRNDIAKIEGRQCFCILKVSDNSL